MQMHMSAAARPIAPSYSGRGHATAGPLGWLAAVAAAAGLVWLVFGKALSSWAARFGPGGRTGGKWVSDRSLGGKMVSHVSERRLRSYPVRGHWLLALSFAYSHVHVCMQCHVQTYLHCHV